MHVYGPVPSRRFGLSLGVDPVPPKTCTYDCAYCQQGRTTRLVSAREILFPLEEILSDARSALARGPAPDVVTIAGSGEPTLYASLGPLIEGLRRIAASRIVLLTNGSLLSDPGVRADASLADVVSPSLDAADAATFQRINRPHPSISFDAMVEGLGTFRREFCGTYLLEVFIAAGLNDDPDHLARLAPLARSIGADAIQLNTAVRPAPGRRGLALSVDRLRALLPLFGPTAEVIASSGAAPRGPSAATQADILAVIERRPSTQADLAAALGLHVNEVAKALDALLAAGTIVEDGLHFRLRDRAGE